MLRIRLGVVIVSAASIVVGACGSTVIDRTSASGSGGTGGSSSASTTDGSGGNPCAPDSCSGPSSSSSGGATFCGGLAGIACPDGFYCDFAGGACGGDDTGGTCAPVPTGCDKHLEPTCGCDGKIYSNPCLANLAGLDTSSSKSCMFTCGTAVCAHGTEYCQISTGGEMPDDYACLPVPDACNGQPSCACISCSACSQSDAGDVTVTCEGF
jgi:hypothetical protein